jgi:heavy metal sensor kinase
MTLIRLALSEKDVWRRLLQLVAGLLGALPVALAMAGFGGYFLARRALAPIEGMARRAREINADQLHARLVAPDPNDELGHMAAAFNDTLARLERSFEQLRRFTSDAAHELRTPLTAIRSVGEVGLRTEAGAEHYREVIASMLEEVSRLTRLVDGLLAVARADAGQVQLERTGVAVLELARDVAAFLEALAEEKGLILSVEGDDSVLVSGDRLVLRQVLVNLLDNAIKYSPAGGRVAVRVLCDGEGQAAIEVEDSGPGIAAEHRERVFDRFYRVDEARSREAGGVGLGLAMAKWGAEAHGGRLDLVSGDSGCRFRLRLPAARREPASS